MGFVADERICNPRCTAEDIPRITATMEENGQLARTVSLPDYWIDVTEVTIEDYAEMVATGVVSAPPERCEHAASLLYDYATRAPCSTLLEPTGWSADGTPPPTPQRPVTCVSRDDAERYCRAKGGRLPTAPEWIKAARGALPSRRQLPWSDGDEAWAEVLYLPATPRMLPELFSTNEYVPQVSDPGWTCDSQRIAHAFDVATMANDASPYGLRDMLGNAAEWVAITATGDWYEMAQIDVLGGAFGDGSMLMQPNSDGWQFHLAYGMSSHAAFGETEYGPTSRDRMLGFRCAYDVLP